MPAPVHMPLMRSPRSAYALRRYALYHTPKWESHSSQEDLGEPFGGADALTLPETDREDDQPFYKDPIKCLKISLPHIALLIALLSYTALGSLVLQQLEIYSEIELAEQRNALIENCYYNIGNQTWSLISEQSLTQEEWVANLKDHLLRLSSIHEKDESYNPRNPIITRWTFPTTVLYILTVLTTCGYGHVEPQTTSGRIFAIAFALIGIPLMFITAADIGKFLSEIIITFRLKLKSCLSYLSAKFAPAKSPKVATPNSAKVSESSRSRIPPDDDDLLNFLEEGFSESLIFPIVTYVVVVCGYCALGAWLYCSWEYDFTFIGAFHFSFNLITTVGLGMIVVTNGIYLILIVAYIIIGLAVVTMCVDLASTQLKAYFTKIHYFGRARPKFYQDLRDIFATLNAMRQTGRDGQPLTWAELREILQQQSLSMRPFAPRHLHLWRYIDETTSSNISTLRHNSFQSDMICCSSASARLAAVKQNGGSHMLGGMPEE